MRRSVTLLGLTGITGISLALSLHTLNIVDLSLAGSILELANRAFKYTDGPFSQEERLAVSLLTNLGALQGNPDGTFQPQKTVNRAEFLKIVLLSHPSAKPSIEDKRDCFPDVHLSDWFSPYVCAAQQKGIVQGYLDGLFHPERAVTYTEALKILSTLFAYDISALPGEPWYRPYVRSALFHGTMLPDLLSADHLLTRGEVARLTANFRVEHEGELSAYRDAELGKIIGMEGIQSPNSTTPTDGAPKQSTTGEGESQQSSSSQENDVTVLDLPSRSHLLLLGKETPPLADGLFSSNQEGLIRIAEVKLKKEMKSLNSLSIVDAFGLPIGTLSLSSSDADKRTWRGEFPKDQAYLLPAGTQVVLAVQGNLKERGAGGRVEELLEIERFVLSAQTTSTGESWEVHPTQTHFPAHQTVQAKMTRVERVYGEVGQLTKGEAKLIAAFDFFGESPPGTELLVKMLTLSLESNGVKVPRWELAGTERIRRYGCAVRSEAKTLIDCHVPPSIGLITDGSHTLYLFGDVVIDEGVSYPSLRVVLKNVGSIGQEGALRWSDGTGEYTWIEGESPLAQGTLWK